MRLLLLAAALAWALPPPTVLGAGSDPNTADNAARHDTAGWIGRVGGTVQRNRDGEKTVLTDEHYLTEIQCRDEFRCDPGGTIEILTLNGTKELRTDQVWFGVRPRPPVALVQPGTKPSPTPAARPLSRIDSLGTRPLAVAARPAPDLATPTVAFARLVRTRAAATGIRRPLPASLARESLDELVVLWAAGTPAARVRIVVADDGGKVLVRHNDCPNTGRYDLTLADRAALRGELGHRLELKLSLKTPGAAVENLTTTFALRDPDRVAALLSEIEAPVPGWPPELADVIRASRLVQAGLLDKAREFLVRAQETEGGRRSAVVRDLVERVDSVLPQGEAVANR